MADNTEFSSSLHGEDPSRDSKWLLNNTFMKLRDAEAMENWPAYFVYFKHILLLLINKMDVKTREIVDQEMTILIDTEQAIKDNPQLADESKRKQIIELRRSFVDAHLYYIFRLRPRAGLDQAEEEGELDFEQLDMDALKHVVRGRDVKDNMGKLSLKEAETPEAEPQPEIEPQPAEVDNVPADATQ